MNRDTFDRWRKLYDKLTFHEQQQFYNKIIEQYPQNPCFTRIHRVLREFLYAHSDLSLIIELGGYDGSLAKAVLPDSKIAHWDNYEIIQRLPQVCTDRRYNYITLKRHFWDLTQLYESDLFIASHIFEHLKLADIEKIAAFVKSTWVFLEIPIPWKGEPNWTQFNGTHIIDGGLEDVVKIYDHVGYHLIQHEGVILVFRRDN